MEIRNVEIKNNGMEEEVLEITSYIEPILANELQENAHPAFNKLFLSIEYVEDNILIVKRRKRKTDEKEIYMAVSLYSEDKKIGDMEYEIDKEKFIGRGNLNIPVMVENSKPFSKNTNLSLNPIIAMKRTVSIKPQDSMDLSLIISVSNKEDEAIENLKKYFNKDIIKKSFELSKARAEAETRYLGLNSNDIETYQKMLGLIINENPFKKFYLNKNKKENFSQEDLWKFGISGDIPIVLLKIDNLNGIYVLEDMLKAYEFYRSKNIEIDLVILDEEENNYEKYVKEEIVNSILNRNLSYMQNIRGGIFVLEEKDAKELFEFRSNLIIDSNKGQMSRQLKDLEEEYLDSIKNIGNQQPNITLFEDENKFKNNNDKLDIDTAKYYNEYGGFIKDGKEYSIKINKENRLPTVWSHVISNEKFGSILTDSMGGFTWSKNSRLNKISAWSNDQILDIPSEIIYMQEKDTLKTWSLGLNPMPDENDYFITYGFGYAKYKHTSMEIEQNLKVFIPTKDSIKVNLLNLKNLSPQKKKLKLVYYIKPVLGEDETVTNGFIQLENKKGENTILLKNRYSNDNYYAYISSSEKINSYTGSRKFFMRRGWPIESRRIKKGIA